MDQRKALTGTGTGIGEGVRLMIKRSRVRYPVGAQLRNDSGQVAHTHLPRHRQSSFLYGVVKLGIFTVRCVVVDEERTG